ncbi:MAG: hypothetical protein AAFV25_28045, partial [Bacteroidota bacterium]
SDHYMHAFLKRAVNKQEVNGGAFQEVLEAMEDMDSGHYLALTIKSIARKGNLSDNQLVDLIYFTADVDSDHHKTEALVALSKQTKKAGGKALETYRKVAKDIDSEVYYGRALKAID